MAVHALDNEGHRTVKINGKKDLTAERVRARQVIDAVFIPRIKSAMGDPTKFALYREKATLAKSGRVMSEGDDAIDIIARFDASLQRIAAIEDERQAEQARVDNANTAMEIDEILKGIING